MSGYETTEVAGQAGAAGADSDPDFADSRTLGRLIYRARQRTGTLQRILTARTGISQPNISAYELGRRQPTWPTFVRLIAAMDQRPVIEIGPAERKLPLSRLLDHLDEAIRDVLTVVDGLPYRFESDAALQLLGKQTTPDIVRVSAVADIEDLTQRALDRLDRQIMTRRGGSDRSRVQFDCGPLFVSIMLIAEPRQSVQVVHGGRVVNVAPLPDAINPWI
jgi:transcriptional regulator with XRE-family HTH domain